VTFLPLALPGTPAPTQHVIVAAMAMLLVATTLLQVAHP
jgi:hypothetical protein